MRYTRRSIGLPGVTPWSWMQDELVNHLRTMRAEIVELESPQTGTPLPSTFTPALLL